MTAAALQSEDNCAFILRGFNCVPSDQRSAFHFVQWVPYRPGQNRHTLNVDNYIPIRLDQVTFNAEVCVNQSTTATTYSSTCTHALTEAGTYSAIID